MAASGSPRGGRRRIHCGQTRSRLGQLGLGEGAELGFILSDGGQRGVVPLSLQGRFGEPGRHGKTPLAGQPFDVLGKVSRQRDRYLPGRHVPDPTAILPVVATTWV
jgi:hypothetical protein